MRLTGALSQDEVTAELARADLFALPSFAEGVPVVLMEAMAAGLPVLATAIAGIPELVEDGVSGRLVAPGDTSGFAAAMADLLADPARARAMGRAGRQKVAAEFSIAGEAAKLDGLFGN